MALEGGLLVALGAGVCFGFGVLLGVHCGGCVYFWCFCCSVLMKVSASFGGSVSFMVSVSICLSRASLAGSMFAVIDRVFVANSVG